MEMMKLKQQKHTSIFNSLKDDEDKHLYPPAKPGDSFFLLNVDESVGADS
jgi:hypothetical protein